MQILTINLFNMKKNILDKLWIDLGLDLREDEIIRAFHFYSDLVADAITGIPFQGRPNPVIHVTLSGTVYVYWDQKLEWIEEIMALIAIWKQKKTQSQTLQHERKLGMFGVVQKNRESIQEFRNKSSNIWAASSRLNHLLPLYYAYQKIKNIRFPLKEDKVILLGIVFTYARLNGIPPEIFFEGEDWNDIEWDDLIYKNFKWFDPRIFWLHYASLGYIRIPKDLFDNFIIYGEKVVGKAAHGLSLDNQRWIYTDSSSSWARLATTTMLLGITKIMGLWKNSTQSPPSASSHQQDPLSP